MFKRNNIFKSVSLFMVLVFSWGCAMANAPSVRPDWKNTTSHVMNLSGQKVKMVLPGNVSGDVPKKIDANVNIYDPDIYGDWRRYEAAKIWWDYKKRVMFFIPDVLATLELKVAVYTSTDDGSGLLDPSMLENVLHSIAKEAYPEPENANRIPREYQPVNIESKTWLKYIKKGKGATSERLCFAAALTDDRLIEISFRLIESKERSEANWYATAQSDIEKIISSVKIERSN